MQGSKWHVGEKNDWKGMKKGGRNPPIGKQYAYFFPNWLKIYKIAKKMNIFTCGAHPLNIIYFIWGEKYKSGRGRGQKMNLKFNIHPWSGVCSNKPFKLSLDFKNLVRSRATEDPGDRRRRGSAGSCGRRKGPLWTSSTRSSTPWCPRTPRRWRSAGTVLILNF